MGIGSSLISMCKEVILFNSFESIFIVSLVLIYNNIRISKLQYIFHIFMLSVSNYVFSNIAPFPVIMQFIYIILLGFYFCMIFKIKLFKSIICVIKSLGILFIIEVILAIIYKNIFNLELISMSNEYIKFLYMIPFRCVEILFIGLYYRILKGGEKYYEKNNKSYNQQW